MADRDCGWNADAVTVDAACKTCNNRQCIPCVSGTTWSSSGTDKKGGAGIKCTPITQCCASTGAPAIKFAGSATADRSCVDCGTGKFSATGTDHAAGCCSACATCTENTQYYSKTCTKSQDATCGTKTACCTGKLNGYAWGTQTAVGAAGTCTACVAGTSFSASGTEAAGACCAACTDCTATDKFYATACTATTSSTCGDKTKCCAAAAVVGFSVGTSLAAGKAGTCEACSTGKFSASGFEVLNACCAAHKTCNAATEYVKTLGTATTDVVCGLKTVCCTASGLAGVVGWSAGSATVLGAAGTCKPCSAGVQFSATGLDANGGCCAACSGCTGTDKFFSKVCTANSDNTCGDKASCCARSVDPATDVVGFTIGSLTVTGSAGTCLACSAGKWSPSGMELVGACCADHTACATDKFTLAVGTVKANTVCGAKTTCCAASSAVVTGYIAGSLTVIGAGGSCPACGAGKFSASGLDANAACCADWSVCTAGQFWKTLGTVKTDAACSTCGTCKTNIPTANTENTMTACALGSASALGSDTTCKTCSATGTPMWDKNGTPNNLNCVANKQCCVQKGEYESVKGTRTSDTTCATCAKCNRFATACNDVLGAGTCAACAKGTFSATAKDMTDGKCTPWHACKAGQWLKTAGTDKTDNVCVDCTECKSPMRATTLCQPTADAVCAAPKGCPRSTWSTEPIINAAATAAFPAFSALVAVVLALRM